MYVRLLFIYFLKTDKRFTKEKFMEKLMEYFLVIGKIPLKTSSKYLMKFFCSLQTPFTNLQLKATRHLKI